MTLVHRARVDSLEKREGMHPERLQVVVLCTKSTCGYRGPRQYRLRREQQGRAAVSGRTC